MKYTVEITSIHKANVVLCQNAKTLRSSLFADKRFEDRESDFVFDKTVFEYTVSDWSSSESGVCILHTFSTEVESGTEERTAVYFIDMLKAFKSNLFTLQAIRIDTLWDDIAFRYCENAYPIILKTENLMRKLITKFMLKTLGAYWIEHSAPKEVREEIGKTKRVPDGADPLHNVDFATLSEYLLKAYASEPQESIHKIIKIIDPTKTEEIAAQLKKLKSLIPQSNWSRYFSKIVDCEDTYLKKQWSTLYNLRCKVAHNTFISPHEFSQINELCAELNAIIGSAIERLAEVKVSILEVAELEVLATTVSESAQATSLQDTSRERIDHRPSSLNFGIKRLYNMFLQLAADYNIDACEPETLDNIARKFLARGIINVEEKRVIDSAVDVFNGNAGQVIYSSHAKDEAAAQILMLTGRLQSRFTSPSTATDGNITIPAASKKHVL